jgi:hypothetical protein
MALSAPDATLMITTHDEWDLPVKTILQDAESTPLRHVILQRDSDGRVINVEVSLDPRSLVESYVDQMPVEKRDTMALFLKQAFGDVFSRTAYAYDTQGRLLERTDTMGSLSGTRTRYRYNGHDDPIEETAERRSREANVDESGALLYSPDSVNVHHNRLEYRYDAQGNWTEKIVSFRTEPDSEFQLSNTEQRVITYHSVV